MKPLLLFFFSLLAIGASAQLTEKIETDRPDQTESPYLVPKKYLQGEFGANRETYRGNAVQYLHPTALLKYGLSNRVELRLEATYLTRNEESLPDPLVSTALEPVEIGTKIRFWEEKGLRPKTSLITHIGLPFIASRRYHNDPVNFSSRLTFQNSLSERVGLGYNLGIEGGGSESTSYFYTFAPGFTIGERWYAYAEAFGSFYKGFSEHNLDGGLAYYLTNNTKLDVSAGFGLGNSLLKHYVALGFSFRNLLRK